jgi:hypothetical protein
MRIRLVTIFAAGAFGVVAAACTLSTPPLPDRNETEFCADWANAICQLSKGPCSFSESVCATYQTGQCMNFVGAAQTGTRQFNQPNAKACIDALNAAYGGGGSGSTWSVEAATLVDVSAKCIKVVIGTQPAGQPCTSDNDCAGTLTCAPLVGQNQSVCTSSVTPKDAGDFCADPGDECQGNSYCAAASGLAKCVPTPATGGSCSQSVPCGSTDACVNGTCQPRGLKGAPCTSNDDCDATAAYCDAYSGGHCSTGLAFAPGSFDCNGVAGLSSGGGIAAGPPDAALPD